MSKAHLIFLLGGWRRGRRQSNRETDKDRSAKNHANPQRLSDVGKSKGNVYSKLYYTLLYYTMILSFSLSAWSTLGAPCYYRGAG